MAVRTAGSWHKRCVGHRCHSKSGAWQSFAGARSCWANKQADISDNAQAAASYVQYCSSSIGEHSSVSPWLYSWATAAALYRKALALPVAAMACTHLVQPVSPPPRLSWCTCLQVPCPVDCQVSDWADVNQCNRDNGIKMQARSVTVWPINGAACPELLQEVPCAVDCETTGELAWRDGKSDEWAHPDSLSRCVGLCPAFMLLTNQSPELLEGKTAR